MATFLIHIDPETVEPIGAWGPLGQNVYDFDRDADRAEAKSVLSSLTGSWIDKVLVLSERHPNTVWWETIEASSAIEALAKARGVKAS